MVAICHGLACRPKPSNCGALESRFFIAKLCHFALGGIGDVFGCKVLGRRGGTICAEFCENGTSGQPPIARLVMVVPSRG
jgi:hypothetical protein